MRVKCLAQEHNEVPRPELEPGPFDPESSALTIRPPCLLLSWPKESSIYSHQFFLSQMGFSFQKTFLGAVSHVGQFCFNIVVLLTVGQLSIIFREKHDHFRPLVFKWQLCSHNIIYMPQEPQKNVCKVLSIPLFCTCCVAYPPLPVIYVLHLLFFRLFNWLTEWWADNCSVISTSTYSTSTWGCANLGVFDLNGDVTFGPFGKIGSFESLYCPGGGPSLWGNRT